MKVFLEWFRAFWIAGLTILGLGSFLDSPAPLSANWHLAALYTTILYSILILITSLCLLKYRDKSEKVGLVGAASQRVWTLGVLTTFAFALLGFAYMEGRTFENEWNAKIPVLASGKY